MTCPIVRWAGGKRQLASVFLPLLRKMAPPGGFSLVVDPFLGGAGLFLAVRGAGLAAPGAREVVGDAAAPLIYTYRRVLESPGGVATELRRLEGAFVGQPEAEQRRIYLERRELLNVHLPEARTGGDNFAALFIWLNKAAFNGLWRVNRQGLFNVAWNKRPRPLGDLSAFLASVQEFSSALAGVSLWRGPWERTLRAALRLGPDRRFGAGAVPKGALLLLDPPYCAVSGEGSGDEAFRRYTAGVFGPPDHARLLEAATTWADAGGRVVMFNAAHGSTLAAYRDAGLEVREVGEARLINCVGTVRGKVPCLIGTA